MHIQVQRETSYNQTLAVSSTNSHKIVWCWRKHARAHDWNISKTVTPANGEIPNELSETEASQLPFGDRYGYISVYEIDPSTGRKSYVTGGTVEVIEGTAGSDYTSTSTLQTAIPFNFSMEGAAQIQELPELFIPSADGYITKFIAGCQDAPLGTSIIFELYKNGTATGETIELAAGDTRNTKTVNISVAQADLITAKITQWIYFLK